MNVEQQASLRGINTEHIAAVEDRNQMIALKRENLKDIKDWLEIEQDKIE